MYLKYLRLCSFRNYSESTMYFEKGLNVICGKNGSGKTTLLEAIFLLSTGRSFRTSHLSNLIKKGASYFFIEGCFIKDTVEQTLSIGYDNRVKKIQYNHTYLQNFSHVLGILPSVLFSPSDINLISGSPAERRRFLNIQLAQTDPLYVHHLSRYHKARKQRNFLLKKKSEKGISSFEQMMATSAHYLIRKRKHLVQLLKPKINQCVAELSLEKDRFNLFYEPSISSELEENKIKELYAKQRSKDFIFGTSLIGPHRDDLLITYDKKNAKSYASEGQNRTFITALKMAEWNQLKSKSDCLPLMHIDDFGTHLDQNRICILKDKLSDFNQVFLTTPKSSLFPSAHTLNLQDNLCCANNVEL